MGIERWKRVKPLKNHNIIPETEKKYNFVLPDEVKQCIAQNNGGRPIPNIFSFGNGKDQETDIKCFLSYNQDDKENVFNVIDYFVNEYHGSIIPVAMDSAGNYICLKGSEVVLWTQEKEVFKISKDFSSFVSSVYSLD